MSVLGWLLAMIGAAGLVFALRLKKRMKTMQTVPFKTPSEIAAGGASVADGKGMISTEGKSVPGAAPLIAPMSGQPCLAYKIVVERKWEDSEETENGTKKKSGKNEVLAEYRGGQFRITDFKGGAVAVDVEKEPEAEFEQSHSSTIQIGTMIPGSLAFGQFQVNTPRQTGEGYTVAFVGSEKILKPGTLYAMGALKGGVISKPEGMLGKLLLSSKGRAAMLATTRRNMMLGYAIGGVLAFSGTLLGLFGPKPAHSMRVTCVALSGAAACEGRITRPSGDDVKWTVPAPGKYQVAIHQPNVKRPIDAVLTILDAAGNQVAFNDDDGKGGTDASVDQLFAAGTYTINVRDFARRKMSGGQGYSLVITAPQLPVAAMIAPAADPVCAQARDCCIADGASPQSCKTVGGPGLEKYCANALDGFRKIAKQRRNKAAIQVCGG